VPVQDIVAALRACGSDRRPLVVLHHGGVGAAVGRSLAVEAPDVPVLVVETPPDAAGIARAATEAHRGWHGYREVVYGTGGVRTVPVVAPMEVALRDDTAIPLGPGEVCLVTGGARGIAVECALALGGATGARLVLLGRSPDADPEVQGTLARFASAGVAAVYQRVDITDPGAVGPVVAGIRDRYGPVRMLVHAAGYNQPRAIDGLTADELRTTLAPKAHGLDHLVAALDPADLRMAVTFGSVIGRTGLAGEAAYAVANEWLARRCAELTTTRPGTRWLNIEWSAWSGTGMGVRLGVLDNLERQGLSPIPVDQGVDWLLRLLSTPELPPTVLVTGRLPVTATLRWDGDADGAGGRFLESRLSHTPGVEVVAEASVSLGTDPYLADHRIDGTPVLPAVFGLEAMAQACAALGAKPLPARFEDVLLSRPITVPERDSRGLRVAALAGADGDIEVVARSDETGFSVDHFRATRAVAATNGAGSGTDDDPEPGPTGSGELLGADHLYGPLFFHGPRLHRVRGYHAVSAYRCTVAVDADAGARWFGGFVDQNLELGDPGARDAFLHALQVCVPDRRVLPVAAERIRVLQRPEGRLVLDARQRDEDGDTYVFDLVVRDAGRSVVEQWHGLTLRAVGPVEVPRWPVEVIGAYLTRTLRRWRPDLELTLAVAPAGDRRSLADWLAVPVAGGSARRARSLAACELDGRVLVASGGPGPLAVAWQRVDQDGARTVAARTVTGREVLASCGGDPAAALAVDQVGPGGWVRLAGGAVTLYSAVVETTAGRLAVCVGLDPGGAG
jgi:enediyne polyketide synthase